MERNVNNLGSTVEHAAGTNDATSPAASAPWPRAEHVAEDVHPSLGRVADAASRLKEGLLVGGGQLRAAQARFSAGRRVQIRKSPFASVALAFGAGIALGWLLRSR